MAAGEVLAAGLRPGRSEFVVLDLREEAERRNSGGLPATLAVEGRLWGSALMLEGVLRWLEEIRGKVGVRAGLERRRPSCC